MNKREIARQFSLDTVIYDPELSTKAAKALSADMIEVSPEQCFDMDVVFDRHVYQNADFYRFPLIKESLHPKGREPKGKEEKLKQRMYDILNEQRIYKTARVSIQDPLSGKILLVRSLSE